MPEPALLATWLSLAVCGLLLGETGRCESLLGVGSGHGLEP